jgi:PRTRC genetic system protein A
MIADIVMDGAGRYLAAVSPELTIRVRLAHAVVPGLSVVQTGVVLRQGLIHATLWQAIVERARAAMPHEVLLAVVARHPVEGELLIAAAGPYALVEPQLDEFGAGDWQPQQVSGCSVRATPVHDAILEVHSHHAMRAYFSATDDRDETGRRVYGVLGRLDSPRPELAFRMATGCNPHAIEPVPFGQVFAADLGDFHDVNFRDFSSSEPRTNHARTLSARFRAMRTPSIVTAVVLDMADDLSAIRYFLEEGRSKANGIDGTPTAR